MIRRAEAKDIDNKPTVKRIMFIQILYIFSLSKS